MPSNKQASLATLVAWVLTKSQVLHQAPAPPVAGLKFSCYETTTSSVLCRSSQFDNAFDDNFLSNPQNCPYQKRSLRELGDNPEDPLDVPAFFKHAAVWLVATSLGSLGLGMVFLALFRHAPKAMVSQE